MPKLLSPSAMALTTSSSRWHEEEGGRWHGRETVYSGVALVGVIEDRTFRAIMSGAARNRRITRTKRR